jgi:hypothetical protein
MPKKKIQEEEMVLVLKRDIEETVENINKLNQMADKVIEKVYRQERNIIRLKKNTVEAIKLAKTEIIKLRKENEKLKKVIKPKSKTKK